MGRCDTCALMIEEYDALRRDHDDVRIEGDETDHHYCPMYDDHIPADIYDGSAKCKFYDAAEQ